MAVFRTGGLNFRRKRRKMKVSTAKGILLWIVEIFIVLLIAFVLVYCAGMRVNVVGNSMEKTLSDGSVVLVNRFVYNIKEPKAGDVVVFLPNGNEKSHYYIKRVIGVPGDKVQIKNGLLYVNGELYDVEDTETIKNAGLAEDEITVGDDEYFVLGDNRNSSEDSRYANIENIKKKYIKGKAKVFEGDYPAFEAIQNGEIVPGDIIVIRYEGCKGAPGMKELMLSIDALIGKGLDKSVGLVTDARFSGFNYGAIIGHVSPEAYDGGVIALVENGDEIEIDIPKGTVDLLVSDEELAERRKNWVCPPLKQQKGCLNIYAQMCRPAEEGGAMQPWPLDAKYYV